MKFHSKMFGWEYAWQEFASEMNGSADLDEKLTPPVKGITVPLGNGSVEMHANTQKRHTKAQTIVWTEFVPASDFTFAIHTETWTDSFGKLMGMEDIEIGDQQVDERFIIKSNDQMRLVEMFADPNMRASLLNFNHMNVQIVPSGAKLPHGKLVPEGRHALCYTQEQIAQSFEELNSIYSFLKGMIQELSRADVPADKQRTTFAERFAQQP